MARFAWKQNKIRNRQRTLPAKATPTRAIVESIEPRLLLSGTAATSQQQSTNVHTLATVITVPGAPTSLVAKAASASQINLTWSTPDSLATGYFIERSVAGSAFTKVGTVTAKTFSDTGLAANTAYTYRVTATNSAGSSKASATASATTLNKAPNAPIGLTATAASSSQINLTWTTTDSLATGYIIKRSSAGVAATTIATVTTKSYSNTGLAANTAYTYQVIATNAVGNSAASSSASATTKALAPGKPTNLTATAYSTTQINLTWTAADMRATGYIIERSTNGTTFTQIATVTTTSYSNVGLGQGTTYIYRVTATNSGGSSPVSATATATTKSLPVAPTGLAATVISASQINLSWTSNDAQTMGFYVMRSVSGGAFTQIAKITTKTYSDTGLAKGTKYTYEITAYNASGTSPASAAVSATIVTAQAPATPTNLVATAASISQINLTWTAADALATGFRIERSLNGGAFAQVTTVTTTNYSDTGLAEGAAYTYRVTAYNAAGSSAASTTATATTLQRPGTPVNLVAMAASISQINLTWLAGGAAATGFTVERSDNGGAFTQISNVATTSYNDTGLAEGATYTYRVTAYNAGGSSVASNTATAATLQRPGTPTNLVATSASISQINLTWSAGDALANGFIVERSDQGGAFAQIASVTSTSYSDAGLAEGASYTYRVTAYDAGGSSPVSTTATTATLQRPGAPTNLNASAASISEIDLTWSPSDALANGFIVERSSGGGAFTQVADVTTASYSDVGLSEGTAYTYRVTAYDAGGSSVGSATTTEATLQRPAAPTNLSATAASISQINLAWTASDALATGFIIERSDQGGPFAQIADVTTTTYGDTGLTEGASYTYRVTAYDAGGSSPAGSTATTATLQRPGTPTNLTATAASISQMNLAWSPSDALATGFIVERSSGGGAFTQIADVTAATYSDTGLAEGAAYTYRVTAYDAAGSVAPSSTVTQATLQRPGTPKNLTAAAASISQINLTWAAADSLATDFIVERSIDNILFTQVADVTTNSFSDSGLLEGVSYAYRVTAHNAGGSSAASAVIIGKTLQRPATPTGLTATEVNSSQINLKWTAADTFATGFIVERSINSGAYSQIANITGTTYSDTGLTTLSTYAYRVTAYNASGSLAGATVTTTIKSPGTPTSVAATPATTTQAKLTWKPADTLATDYIVERSADGGATFAQVADVTAVSYTDSGLQSGASYSYRVTAHNALGSSAVSVVATVKVPVPPQPVANLTATTISANEVDLTWSAGDAITTGYLVERSSNNGTTYTQVATVIAAGYNDTGLVGSTAYVYRVTATTAYGSSTPSVTAATPTLQAPPAPPSITAVTASTSEIDLSWMLSDATATGYFIQRSTNFGAYVQIANFPVSPDTATPTTFSDTGLAQNTIYTYRVAAYDASGYAAGPVAQATTLANPIPTPPSVQPSATNSGVAAGVTLTTMGAFKPKSNTTYSNLLITGQMTLTNLTNITFINCVIDANNATYDIRCDGASNILIQNCELKNAASAAVYGDGFSAINDYVHQSGGDGFKPGNNVLLYGNYVSDLGFLATGAHADGVQITATTHVIIVGNYFNMPIDHINTDSNSALFLSGAARDVIFANNWVVGGNYTIHAFADGGGGSTIQIVNNVFYSGSARYGFGSIDSSVIWQGNLTDTGLVALPTNK